MKPPLSIAKHTLLFSLITIFFVVPHLILHGTNIVTHTFAFGTHRFFAGLSPFVDPKGAGDWFKYSPLFAMLYSPYAALGESLQASLWGVTNIVLFWLGVSMWFRWGKTESKWLWLALLFCSMEADGSFRYQQMNAALVGCTLISIALYRDNKLLSAGILLAIITDIKLLPGLFLFGLAIPFRYKYLLGVALGFSLSFLIPCTVVGWETNLAFYNDRWNLLALDLKADGLLDIATVLQRYGFVAAREWVSYPAFLISLIALMISRIHFKEQDWASWISLGLLTLLLVSPRTESPTFVLAGPTYVLLMYSILKDKMHYRWLSISVWLVGIFLVTLCMNDIWPRKVWNASSLRYANKTIGVFLLWALALGRLLPQPLGRMKRGSYLLAPETAPKTA